MRLAAFSRTEDFVLTLALVPRAAHRAGSDPRHVFDYHGAKLINRHTRIMAFGSPSTQTTRALRARHRVASRPSTHARTPRDFRCDPTHVFRHSFFEAPHTFPRTFVLPFWHDPLGGARADAQGARWPNVSSLRCRCSLAALPPLHHAPLPPRSALAVVSRAARHSTPARVLLSQRDKRDAPRDGATRLAQSRRLRGLGRLDPIKRATPRSVHAARLSQREGGGTVGRTSRATIPYPALSRLQRGQMGPSPPRRLV